MFCRTKGSGPLGSSRGSEHRFDDGPGTTQGLPDRTARDTSGLPAAIGVQRHSSVRAGHGRGILRVRETDLPQFGFDVKPEPANSHGLGKDSSRFVRPSLINPVARSKALIDNRVEKMYPSHGCGTHDPRRRRSHHHLISSIRRAHMPRVLMDQVFS